VGIIRIVCVVAAFSPITRSASAPLPFLGALKDFTSWIAAGLRLKCVISGVTLPGCWPMIFVLAFLRIPGPWARG
jgi:hypothetical protein